MADPRYPTLEEFRRRLEVRDVEPDLAATLIGRLDREDDPVERVGDEATVTAVAARLVPGEVPPRALAAFVDQVFDRQLGRADDRHGIMPRERLIPEGFKVLDTAARRRFRRKFADLVPEERDELLTSAERGELRGGRGFDSATWFKRIRQLMLLAYGSDPRGMVQMGFPGPSYRPGHVWLDRGEVRARAERRPGYLRL